MTVLECLPADRDPAGDRRRVRRHHRSTVVTDLLGPRRYNRAKLDAYECGIEPTPLPAGTAGRFPIKYYLTAMLFIVFDIEIVFLYPWAQSADRARGFRAGRDRPVHRHGRSSPTSTSGGAAAWTGTDRPTMSLT